MGESMSFPEHRGSLEVGSPALLLRKLTNSKLVDRQTNLQERFCFRADTPDQSEDLLASQS